MEQKNETQAVRTSEIVIDATVYRIKSIFPDSRSLREIILRTAVNEAVNQAAYV